MSSCFLSRLAMFVLSLCMHTCSFLYYWASPSSSNIQVKPASLWFWSEWWCYSTQLNGKCLVKTHWPDNQDKKTKRRSWSQENCSETKWKKNTKVWQGWVTMCRSTCRLGLCAHRAAGLMCIWWHPVPLWGFVLMWQDVKCWVRGEQGKNSSVSQCFVCMLIVDCNS